MTAYYDLGQYSRPVTTTSADAQAWFNRGLVWCTPHEPINLAHVIGTTRKMILSPFGLPTTLRPCVDSDSSRR
jgi:hypothetical protein